MKAFDISKASPAEVRAEADRRTAARLRGDKIAPRDEPLEAVKALRTGEVRFASERKVNVRLPWSVLVGDNAKYAPALRGNKPVIILTSAYRQAKAQAKTLLINQLGAAQPLEGPCRLRALVYEPDRRTRRDIANLTKLVHDAMTGLVYLDDSQLDDVHWIRAAVDIDAPRVEIIVEALT